MKPLILDASQIDWEALGQLKSILRGYNKLPKEREDRWKLLAFLEYFQTEYADQFPPPEPYDAD